MIWLSPLSWPWSATRIAPPCRWGWTPLWWGSRRASPSGQSCRTGRWRALASTSLCRPCCSRKGTLLRILNLQPSLCLRQDKGFHRRHCTRGVLIVGLLYHHGQNYHHLHNGHLSLEEWCQDTYHWVSGLEGRKRVCASQSQKAGLACFYPGASWKRSWVLDWKLLESFYWMSLHNIPGWS